MTYPIRPFNYINGEPFMGLTPGAKQTILLKYKPGMSPGSLGKALGIGVGAVRDILVKNGVYKPLRRHGKYAKAWFKEKDQKQGKLFGGATVKNVGTPDNPEVELTWKEAVKRADAKPSPVDQAMKKAVYRLERTGNEWVVLAPHNSWLVKTPRQAISRLTEAIKEDLFDGEEDK